jgi:HK97 family phage major capsid protein
MYAKELREKLAPLAAQMQAIVAKAKAENNRGLSSEERTAFHALETDYTALEDSIAITEKSGSILDKLNSAENSAEASRIQAANVEQAQDELRLSPGAKRAQAKDPHARAFSSFLRNGLANMSAEDAAFMNKMYIQNAQTTTTTAGGYLIPQGFSDMLEEAKKWFGGIKGVVGKFTTGTGAPFPWPTVNDTANRGAIIGINSQVTEQDFAFNQVLFNAYIGTSNSVLVPLALIQDSYFDMDQLTANLLGTRLGRLYNWKCTVGAGTTEPTGIVTAAVAAGNILTLPTGSTATITYDSLVDAEHSVDPAYRFNPGTAWMFSDTFLKGLKKLVDGNNRPLWQPGLTASFRDGAAVDLVAARPTILDHPYMINQDMAVPAANAYSALIGDMQTFKVREIAGGTTVMRLTERYADYLQVGYIAFQRFDSQLVDAGQHPVAVIQQSAS